MNFDISIRRVTIQMLVPVHGQCCQRPNGSWSVGCNMQTAEFLVDLAEEPSASPYWTFNKKCIGHVLDGSVIVDAKFWQWVCDRVYEEVRLRFAGTAFSPTQRIVMDPLATRTGFGEWSC